jgi:Fic-DOC domain mobile mystery protein B
MVEDWATLPGETPIDPSGLRRKYRWIKTRGQLAGPEAENIRKATLKYLQRKLTRRAVPFDVAWMRRLHKEMFGDVWEWAGELRRVNFQFGVDWMQVEVQLFELGEVLRLWQSMDLLEQSAHLHHRAVWIHPFNDGNGRWARLLSSIWLRLHGYSAVNWPDVISGTKSNVRDEYLASIYAANDGDFEPLVEMHKRFSAGS